MAGRPASALHGRTRQAEGRPRPRPPPSSAAPVLGRPGIAPSPAALRWALPPGGAPRPGASPVGPSGTARGAHGLAPLRAPRAPGRRPRRLATPLAMDMGPASGPGRPPRRRAPRAGGARVRLPRRAVGGRAGRATGRVASPADLGDGVTGRAPSAGGSQRRQGRRGGFFGPDPAGGRGLPRPARGRSLSRCEGSAARLPPVSPLLPRAGSTGRGGRK